MQYKVNLRPFHTFRIDTIAAYFVEVFSLQDLQEALQWSALHQIPYIILGEGSNVLFVNDLQKIVIQIKTKGIEIVAENEESIQVNVAAGMSWDTWLAYAVSQQWQGLENLSLIPGTVGAAPIQNIGAYGVEVKNNIVAVNFWDIEKGRVCEYDAKSCEFGYRTSVFKTRLKQKAVILSVTFSLRKKNYEYYLNYKELHEKFKKQTKPSLQEIRDCVIAIRQQKLPDYNVLGNAGSFFKNPLVFKSKLLDLQERFDTIPFYVEDDNRVKIPAAWLIEQCGWKQKEIEGVACAPQQPLVLVNKGTATGKAVLYFAEQISKSVFQKFEILLEREINVYD